MHGAVKLLIGAGAAALLAYGAHGPLGLGARYADALQQRAAAAIADIPASARVTVRVPMRPHIVRQAILAGETSAAERAEISARVGAVAGIAAVRWVGAPRPDPSPDELARADAAAAACQRAVDAQPVGQRIAFDPGAATMRPGVEDFVTALAEPLKQCADAPISIFGPAERSGDDGADGALSLLRARIVMAVLVNAGLIGERITPVAHDGGPDAGVRIMVDGAAQARGQNGEAE